MILEMLWNFIHGKCTFSLPEILSSGTQIGNKNYKSYRSNHENYNILIPQAVLKKWAFMRKSMKIKQFLIKNRKSRKLKKSRKSRMARKPDSLIPTIFDNIHWDNPVFTYNFSILPPSPFECWRLSTRHRIWSAQH
jgi:hypothetical protein